jgi:type II secretory pathway component PulM
VQLDDLLKLPDSGSYDVERRGGATRGEWRERFVNVQSDLDEERAALAQAKQELEKVAGNADAWKLTPPGATAGNDAPLDYRLRNQIRQHTAEVERLEKQLRDLQVEANLAGVPDSWLGE